MKIKIKYDRYILEMTAHAEFYQQKAIKAGCNQVINMPIEFDNIAPLLKQYLH